MSSDEASRWNLHRNRNKAGHAPLEAPTPFYFCLKNLSFQTASLTEARMKVQHTAPVDL